MIKLTNYQNSCVKKNKKYVINNYSKPLHKKIDFVMIRIYN